ncbi:hypothetical protein C1I99_24215 [Micromonospora deserti]|uniref:TfoX C-terminal domain-containing protein n=1 Tax=Micromonospora deserti TaxID=2070366 RepID=A0A2W2BTP8_9ACTN|nr:hypothetical protein C1I99_24215 [Micromonospora deserti]
MGLAHRNSIRPCPSCRRADGRTRTVRAGEHHRASGAGGTYTRLETGRASSRQRHEFWHGTGIAQRRWRYRGGQHPGPPRRIKDIDMDGTRNLGPASARMLAAIGIDTAADLDAIGAAGVYRHLRDAGTPGLTRNLLWAMEAAPQGVMASRTLAVSTNCSNRTMRPPRTTKWWATRTLIGLPVALLVAV